MKRVALVAILGLSIVMAPASRAFAGNQEWAVAGKILTGLLGLGLLHRAAHAHQQAAMVPAPVYPQPPAYPQAPAPALGPSRTWVDGHYVYDYQKVWVPGYWEKIWEPPVYDTRTVRQGSRTFTERVLISDGYWKQTWQDGYFREERQQVWVPGHWR